ncbi:hypothetical protein A3765_12885 [Oleiphilus sp. HI0130]|nr:hypothetical protein A3765_12885 [Oleiphilus sp. HI0130]
MDLLNHLPDLHFLRPELLALLVLLPLLIWLLRKGVTRDNSWSQHINPTLLQAMQGKQNVARKKRTRTGLLSTSLALLLIAAAGPSWIEKTQPATQRSDNMVVIMDLSLSMLSEDTPPSRLVRAKQKIVDLLSMRKEGSTALIAFSGDSFVVTPLTDDMRTIESNLAALEPLIMPVIGSRPDLAVDQAKDLLAKTGSSTGRIVLVTDGVAPHQIDRITDMLTSTEFELNIIAVGTEEGGPIKLPDNRGYLKDGGSVVIAKTELAPLRALAIENRGVFSELALNDSDLEAINAAGTLLSSEHQQNAIRGEFDQWEDMGFLFLVLALPLCLLAYRQGGLLILLIFISPQQADAFEFSDLWLTPDQQAQRQAQQGNYDIAAQLYASPRHKADALYRSGNYEQAAELYSQFEDAENLYNLGNARARAGQLPEALEAYERSLEKAPLNKQALANKAIIERMLEEQEQAGGPPSEQAEGQDSQQGSETNSDQQSQQQQSQQQGQSSEDTNSQEGGQRSSQKQDENQQDQAQQSTSNTTDNTAQSEDEAQHSQALPESTSDIEQMNQQAQQSQGGSENSDPNTKKAESLADTSLTPEQRKALEEQTPTENQSMAIEESLSSEEQRSYEQWMRRVPDDPSGLLRRKFEQQARERSREHNSEEPLW